MIDDIYRPAATAGKRFDVQIPLNIPGMCQHWLISEHWSWFEGKWEKNSSMVVQYDDGDCDCVFNKWLLFRWIYDAMQTGELLPGDTIYLMGELIAKIPEEGGCEPSYTEPWPEKPK